MYPDNMKAYMIYGEVHNVKVRSRKWHGKEMKYKRNTPTHTGVDSGYKKCYN